MKLSEVRLAYTAALAGKGAEALAATFKEAEVEIADLSVLLAYRAATEAIIAKEVWMPTAKLSHLANAVDLFSQAVASNSTDPEVRMLRILVDNAIPSYLGYTNHAVEDKAVIMANLAQIAPKKLDEELFKSIVGYLAKTELFSTDELAALQGAWSV